MKHLLLTIAAIATTAIAAAQTVTLNSAGRAEDYVNSILGRATKATDSLHITGTERGIQVRNIVANRYFLLSDSYAERDSPRAVANALTGDDKQKAMAAVDAHTDARLYRAHYAFAADLSIFLSDSEIEEVKNVMTYNVVNVTYAAYLDMLPSLQDEEKVQIMAWLKEAREYAIDAETSNKKHETFKKYKGRINNYLSQRGYDLQKEREAWGERVRARGGTL